MTTIEFPGLVNYPVYVGHNFVNDIASHLAQYERVAIFVAAPMVPVAEKLKDIVSKDASVFIKLMPDGESSKSLETLEAGWKFLAENKISRSDLVIAIGGGAVTDSVNFCAATWLRGVDVGLIPTTVLAMVDAAIGGKCGINTESGKNLVGVFNDPKFVYCDLDLLTTLDISDIRAGFAEIVKCGFISDVKILDLIQANPQLVLDATSPQFFECVQRAIEVKANAVRSDRTEKSTNGVGRAALNYGHTLGHAVEKKSGYRWRHGDAVSIGMIFAAELAFELKMLSAAELQLHHDVLNLLNLPTAYSASRLEDLIPIMTLDKKAKGGHLRFVLLNGIGQPQFLTNPASDSLTAAFARLDAK